MKLNVLYEDNHLLVVNKPAGLATMGDGDRTTLHSLAAAYLKQKYDKPHGVYVGIVSRLDSLVSGVIVLARTSKAAARLNTQFADHAQRLNAATSKPASRDRLTPPSIRKTYLAVVRAEPHRAAPLAANGRLDDHLYKDDAAHRMRAAQASRDDAKPASLLFQTLTTSDHSSVLAVAPLTGRKHQIRVQLAARGWPILGDRKYGSQTEWPTGIALHSMQLTIEHPTRREPMTFVCPPPVAWNRVRSRELERQWDNLSW
ncbi:RluA family pseudouridine synthase [Allorhodopirellula heiligendammensis]|uniref:Ribosomal large subunit pseudouridine synthase A n=1 Tax=Allorhodopirellula heiligendammensis TaxID=2714739 RepID=A0A5C6C5M7_9BACT|nr:RluA family pseudouridine synthase [Allorhodopirellula heiligendammensis]TWU19893.1 Ribosomal large subunit pseudouridine synthase A [Allorhodopirellula heiligendammensis]